MWPDLTRGTRPQETHPQPRPNSASSLVSELGAERKTAHVAKKPPLP